jgi:hypothetical protein
MRLEAIEEPLRQISQEIVSLVADSGVKVRLDLRFGEPQEITSAISHSMVLNELGSLSLDFLSGEWRPRNKIYRSILESVGWEENRPTTVERCFTNYRPEPEPYVRWFWSYDAIPFKFSHQTPALKTEHVLFDTFLHLYSVNYQLEFRSITTDPEWAKAGLETAMLQLGLITKR